MKKLLSLFAIIAMMTLTACGTAQAPTQTSPEDQIQNELSDLPEDTELEVEEMDIEDMETPDEGIVDEAIDEIVEEEEMPTEEFSDEIQTLDYVGTWSRLGGTLDGVPQNLDAATIIMTKDKYTSSTSLCTISGDVSVVGNAMDISIKTSDCPGGVLPEYSSTYEISDDGQTLTTTNTQFGGTMVETYSRVE